MAQFEPVSVVDDAVALEQNGAAHSRVRLGLAASGGFLLAAAALMALIGNTGKATQVLKDIDAVSAAANLKNKIDENNKKIQPLTAEVQELLEQGNWSKVADYAYNIYSLEQENERNMALLAKVEKAKQSILSGEYDAADTDIDVVKQDSCSMITVNQISKMKMNAKKAVDDDDIKKMMGDITAIQSMYSRCEDDGGATGDATEDSIGGDASTTENSAAGSSTENS